MPVSVGESGGKDKQDSWFFQARAGDVLTAASTKFSIDLHDSTSDQLAVATSQEGSTISGFVIPQTGDYWIHIFKGNGDYTFKLDLTSPTNPGGDNVDFFSLTVAAADIVSVVGNATFDIEPNSDADFSWVPVLDDPPGLSWVVEGDNTVLLTDPVGENHPIMAGLTNADLSGWGSSQHNYFDTVAGMDVLATNGVDQANILAGDFKLLDMPDDPGGKLVYFEINPSHSTHQAQNEPAQQLIRQAVTWAPNWVTETNQSRCRQQEPITLR